MGTDRQTGWATVTYRIQGDGAAAAGPQRLEALPN